MGATRAHCSMTETMSVGAPGTRSSMGVIVALSTTPTRASPSSAKVAKRTGDRWYVAYYVVAVILWRTGVIGRIAAPRPTAEVKTAS